MRVSRWLLLWILFLGGLIGWAGCEVAHRQSEVAEGAAFKCRLHKHRALVLEPKRSYPLVDGDCRRVG